VSVNRLFYENGGNSSYATLFFADYDDTSRRLCYANCGYLPALLLRNCQSRGLSGDGFTVEHLGSTTTVMGLFDRWECRLAQVQLAPGGLSFVKMLSGLNAFGISNIHGGEFKVRSLWESNVTMLGIARIRRKEFLRTTPTVRRRDSDSGCLPYPPNRKVH
jgi:hypothetical protein